MKPASNITLLPHVSDPQVALALQPNIDVVTLLEEYLMRARSGELRAVALCGVRMIDGEPCLSHAFRGGRLHDLLACNRLMERLLVDYILDVSVTPELPTPPECA